MKIHELIFRRLKNKLTTAEKIELNKWVIASKDNQNVYQKLLNPDEFRKELMSYANDKDIVWDKICQAIPEMNEPQVMRISLPRKAWKCTLKRKGFMKNIRRIYKPTNYAAN